MKNFDKLLKTIENMEDKKQALEWLKKVKKMTKEHYDTVFEIYTFKGKPNKKEKGYIKTTQYSMEVQKAIRGKLDLQKYLQEDYLESMATGN